ncbi:MAG: penicillin-binding protein 2 [Sphaerospermopsis sp. SIO1G2]|nr:penicillin-binding protein 2 [Sphaerospermopsis sp. SIO1G2]
MQKSPSKKKLKNWRNLKFHRQRKFSKSALPKSGKTNNHTQTPNLHSRLLIVWGILLTAGLGLAMNLYRLQIIDGEKLTKRAKSQQMVNLRPFMPRRPVVDRNQTILALDRPVYTLYAHPKLFNQSKEEVAEKLAPLLNQEVSQIVKKLNSKPSGIVVANKIGENIADRLISFRLNGLEFIQKYSRLYPQDDLVANVVGYVDVDRRGQAGVEYSQEKLLERSTETISLSRAGNGALMPDNSPEGFLNYDDLKLQLTLDSRLQRSIRTVLKRQVRKFRAKRGAVIVMDASDGSILAMVSDPTYNANQYFKADIGLFRNWTVADLYEPGSTFKPLNVAIALENKIIQPQDFFSDPGTIKVADRTIKNASINRFRRINIAQILQTSSNVGMVKIIQRMKPTLYYNWLERLGLGQKVDTDLPFEVRGRLKSQEKFLASTIEPATASFGQGFSLTPIQLVQLHGALANGGKLVTPHIVQGLIDGQGKMHYIANLPTPRQVFSRATTEKVINMMETVVSKGSGKESRIPGYSIAGKTGTSQKASPKGGYIPGARITSFVGIIPAEAPRYVVLAIVDEPKGANAYGGTVAAPIVKSVMEVLIPLEKIPPSQN